jgi:hypothetical protein
MRFACVGLLLVAACRGDGKLHVQDGKSVDTSMACAHDTDAGTYNCSKGFTCAYLDLASGQVGPACVPLNVCDSLTCGGSPYFCTLTYCSCPSELQLEEARCVIPE